MGFLIARSIRKQRLGSCYNRIITWVIWTVIAYSIFRGTSAFRGRVDILNEYFVAPARFIIDFIRKHKVSYLFSCYPLCSRESINAVILSEWDYNGDDQIL